MSDDKTQRLVSKWQIGVNAAAQAKDALTLANQNLSKVSAELGGWLIPNDAVSGESFNIWASGSLLKVTVLAGGENYLIAYRNK